MHVALESVTVTILLDYQVKVKEHMRPYDNRKSIDNHHKYQNGELYREGHANISAFNVKRRGLQIVVQTAESECERIT